MLFHFILPDDKFQVQSIIFQNINALEIRHYNFSDYVFNWIDNSQSL